MLAAACADFVGLLLVGAGVALAALGVAAGAACVVFLGLVLVVVAVVAKEDDVGVKVFAAALAPSV